jgi:hypothetical protein
MGYFLQGKNAGKYYFENRSYVVLHVENILFAQWYRYILGYNQYVSKSFQLAYNIISTVCFNISRPKLPKLLRLLLLIAVSTDL